MSAAERCARLLVLVSWMGLITYWSSQGNLPIDQPAIQNLFHGLQHKLAHLCAFGLLALLARWALDGLPRSTLVAIVLTSLFGAADEFHQSFTPGRRPAIDDWAFDTFSGALAVYAWSRLRVTLLRLPVRTLAPLAVSAAFVLGIGLAVGGERTGIPALNRPSVRGVTNDVANGARDFARSTRDLARQMRSAITS